MCFIKRVVALFWLSGYAANPQKGQQASGGWILSSCGADKRFICVWWRESRSDPKQIHPEDAYREEVRRSALMRQRGQELTSSSASRLGCMTAALSVCLSVWLTDQWAALFDERSPYRHLWREEVKGLTMPLLIKQSWKKMCQCFLSTTGIWNRRKNYSLLLPHEDMNFKKENAATWWFGTPRLSQFSCCTYTYQPHSACPVQSMCHLLDMCVPGTHRDGIHRYMRNRPLPLPGTRFLPSDHG